LQSGLTSFFFCGQSFGRKWPIFWVIRNKGVSAQYFRPNLQPIYQYGSGGAMMTDIGKLAEGSDKLGSMIGNQAVLFP